MTDLYIVGDNSEYVNRFNMPWRTGSTRIKNGKKQILVNEHADYAGGCGPLWATEGGIASITTSEALIPIEVHCKKIHTDAQAVELEILKSRYTWGKYCAGQRLVIPIRDIKRYTEYRVDKLADYQLPAPYKSSSKRHHSWIMAEVSAEISGHFDKEVHPRLGVALQDTFSSLNHYKKHYIGPDVVSGRQSSKEAKRKFYKSVRRLERVLNTIINDENI